MGLGISAKSSSMNMASQFINDERERERES
jgi:hypothetical protein